MIIVSDFTTNVHRALREIDPKYHGYKGLVVCGSHTANYLSAVAWMTLIKQHREKGYPVLGICYGYQLAAIEYARNVLGIKDPMSEEWNLGGTIIVRKREKGLKVGHHNGQSYWHNFEVDPEFEKQWKKPDNFILTQYHPEYESRKDKPHPDLVRFINLCKSV